MKTTGIIRRMDELGRVVIPVEIRRTNGWNEGDTFEVFVEEGGMLVLRKYSPLDSGSYDRLIADVEAMRGQVKGEAASAHLETALSHLKAARTDNACQEGRDGGKNYD